MLDISGITDNQWSWKECQTKKSQVFTPGVSNFEAPNVRSYQQNLDGNRFFYNTLLFHSFTEQVMVLEELVQGDLILVEWVLLKLMEEINFRVHHTQIDFQSNPHQLGLHLGSVRNLLLHYP